MALDFPRLLRAGFRQVTLCRPLIKLYDRVESLTSGPQRLGKRGEKAAERYLLRKGLIIVERGYESRSGEIDLVAIDNRTIAFIEVKTRTSDLKGHPTEAVDETKQQHLTSTAYHYLKHKQLADCSFRFDIVSVIWPDDAPHPTVEHFPSAFEPVGQFQLI